MPEMRVAPQPGGRRRVVHPQDCTVAITYHGCPVQPEQVVAEELDQYHLYPTKVQIIVLMPPRKLRRLVCLSFHQSCIPCLQDIS